MLDVMDDIRSAGRKLWRGFGVSVVFALVGGGLWWWQERDYQQFYVWQGVPEARELDWKTLARGLRSDAYLVGWSDLRANPLWVTWRLENTQGSRLGKRRTSSHVTGAHYGLSRRTAIATVGMTADTWRPTTPSARSTASRRSTRLFA